MRIMVTVENQKREETPELEAAVVVARKQKR